MFTIIKYTLASAYLGYKEQGNVNPYYQAVLYLSACLTVTTLAIINIIRIYLNINLALLLGQYRNFVAIFVVLLICFICFKCFSAIRVTEFVEEYKLKPKRERILWGLVAFLLFAIPMCIACFL